MNYDYIQRSISFYRDRGYVYVQDAPWIVGKEAYYSTKPKNSVDILYNEVNHGVISFPAHGENNRYFVASGEQSFIEMMLQNQGVKRAFCVTPCFRVEAYNDWHKPYFMKTELINARDVDEGHLIHMIHDACCFFESVGLTTRVEKTDIGYDIIEKGTRVELGSYGIREYKHYKWIYGTGCAEPRLSTVFSRIEKSTGK